MNQTPRQAEAIKVALACGGTGGHIFPGLATAEVLRERGHEVVLWLAGKDGEHQAVDGWPGPVITVPAEGFAGRLSPRSMGAAWKLWQATRDCRDLMRQDPPDVLLGMGSYATVGPALAAIRLQIPLVLHEANVLPGRAVNLLSRWAAAIAGSFEETRYYLKRKDLVLTGMPIRASLARAAREQPRERRREGPLTFLVMGGSRGAHTLNEVTASAFQACAAAGHAFRVIHLAGIQDEEAVRRQYEDGGVPAEVYGFTRDIGPLYTGTDLAICRSGAASCAELSAFGVPALLVPYPYATNDHQTANGRAMERLGAADVVPEEFLTVSWLQDYVEECMRAPQRLERMRAATRQRARDRGAEALADLVEQVMSGAMARGKR